MYVLAPNQTVEKFPYGIDDLRKDNPQTSFPKNLILETLAAYNVFPVVSTGVEYDPDTQVATQEGCAYNAQRQRWETSWLVRNLTTEELAAKTDAEAASVRQQRNRLLADSDWTQVADAPVNKTAWAGYRQELRDITEQPGFPHNVTWPTQP